MNLPVSLIRLSDLFARTKLVILNPRLCWTTIGLEEPTPRVLSLSVVAPLAVLAVIAPVIGLRIFGIYVEFFGSWRAPLFYSFTNQVLEIAMMISALFLDAWMLHKLAPQFQRSVSFERAFSLVVHSAIPGFLAWGLGIIPSLLYLKPLIFCYCLYILFFGIDKMVPVNATAPKNDTKPAFFSAALALILIIHIVMHALVEPLTPSPFLNIGQ
jgi:hypothetical protein